MRVMDIQKALTAENAYIRRRYKVDNSASRARRRGFKPRLRDVCGICPVSGLNEKN